MLLGRVRSYAVDCWVWVKVVPGEAGGKCLSSTAVVWSSLQHVSSMVLYLSSILGSTRSAICGPFSPFCA